MYNYVVVYVDTIIYEDITIEDAIEHKKELLNNDFYIKKDKIAIYTKLNY